MAFEANALSLLSQRVGSGKGTLWLYMSTDAVGTVSGTDYFAGGIEYGMAVNDVVLVVDENDHTVSIAVVSAIDTDGNATVIAGPAGLGVGTQELTESGAVSASTTIIELNHASVAIAATIADMKVYAGKILAIKDTSASGTAAHTVTVSGGTLDGTNTVATLNAPGEALIVLVDSNGDGIVLNNIASVALS